MRPESVMLGRVHAVPEPSVVVGAAIVAHGRLLAARRTAPARMAGGWELPGGKVDPGESLEAACVREVREELGCEIEVVRRLPGAWPLDPGFELRAVEARLVDGEPVPDEHDALRWLAPEELADVRWLDADRPVVDALREHLLDGERLPGGNVGGAVRIGPTVRRPTGPWTPAVHTLLGWLADVGLDAVPRVLGYDDRGREVLTHVPGSVVYTPRRRMADDQLADLMGWLRRYHEAVRDFRPRGVVRWRFEERALAADEIVCHHDIGWYNVAFTGSRVTGVFDWDVAGPGVPLDDLAFAAWNDVPLVPRPDGVVDDGGGPADAARRLRVLAEAYGGVRARQVLDHVPTRIGGSRRRIAEAAAAGDPGMRRLVGTGVLAKIDDGLAALRRVAPQIERQLSR